MSTSGVGLQVDLAGLASLVSNLGAAGLKKIAQAGVHAHTLLCMVEIAETCPACPVYRREINNCRQQQRKQSVLLYKFVEIGTASNFIADELLKNRAGENILALMSTILPILSEDDCDMFILGLFEARGVDADLTPGFGQLQAFRDAVSPLAQKTAFKDRAYQYHILLSQLRPRMVHRLHSSLPNNETLIKLVLLFQRLDQEDHQHILSYHGWAGAAWVIAYARHILGLPVCVLRTSQDPVPINGEYQNARVLVYLTDDEPRCELLVAGLARDLIVPIPKDECSRWMVDLNHVNLYDLYLPPDPVLHLAISELMRALTLNLITGLVNQLDVREDWQRGQSQLDSYFSYCLPRIRQRGLSVLDKMGFRFSSNTETDRKGWEDHLKICERQNAQNSQYHSIGISPGPTWIQFSLAQTERRSNPEGPPHNPEQIAFSKEGRRVVCFMLLLADYASWLALSDWDETLHTLSAASLARNISSISFVQPFSDSDILSHTVSGVCQTSRGGIIYYTKPQLTPFGPEVAPGTTNNTALIRAHLSEIVMDKKELLPPEDFSEVTASEEHGIVIARAAAGRNSLDLDGILFNFYEGHISMLGERRPQIRSKSHGHNHHVQELKGRACLKPSNRFPELRIQTESRLCRNFVETSTSVLMEDRLLPLTTFGILDDDLSTALITKSCAHSYYAQILEEQGTNPTISFRQGLDLDKGYSGMFSSSGCTIFLQAVDQNPAGQWISVHSGQALSRTCGQFSLILQRHMCTACTIGLIRDMYERARRTNEANRKTKPQSNPESSIDTPSSARFWYIIPARLEGEAMD